MGAVKVWKGAEAQRLREKYTLRSRMVRRKKLMPGVGCFSRWCVLGLDDPDGDNLFAATHQSEVINLFFEAALDLGLNVVFGDVTSAFCQGKKLTRARGQLFASPCEGTGLDPGDLVELMVAVYESTAWTMHRFSVHWAETAQENDLGFRLCVTQDMTHDSAGKAKSGGAASGRGRRLQRGGSGRPRGGTSGLSWVSSKRTRLTSTAGTLRWRRTRCS